MIRDINNASISRVAQREQLDLLKQMNELHLARRGAQDQCLEARIQSFEMAFRMQTEAQQVFDLSQESESTRKAYGTGEFADGCLAARRLWNAVCESCRCFMGMASHGMDHEDIASHADKARAVDQPIAALIQDLKERDCLMKL